MENSLLCDFIVKIIHLKCCPFLYNYCGFNPFFIVIFEKVMDTNKYSKQAYKISK
jgi:hypothetical protein